MLQGYSGKWDRQRLIDLPSHSPKLEGVQEETTGELTSTTIADEGSEPNAL